MQLDVVHFPHGVNSALESDAIVVIDVLRSTSVMAYALRNGAAEILPVQTIAQAREFADRLGRERTVLGGEDGNAPIVGFDAGNSPAEYLPMLVSGKSVVIRTTNGTQALAAVAAASEDRPIYCASFVNLSPVVREFEALPGGAVTFLCCGQDGQFSLEDFLCAGAFVRALRERETETQPTDAALAAEALYLSYAGDLTSFVATGNHAQRLLEMGFGDDIARCCEIDTCPVVPIYQSGRVFYPATP
jgi:2-phosphosulfolactate phosphatase